MVAARTSIARKRHRGDFLSNRASPVLGHSVCGPFYCRRTCCHIRSMSALTGRQAVAAASSEIGLSSRRIKRARIGTFG